jgi:hypothetical protein
MTTTALSRRTRPAATTTRSKEPRQIDPILLSAVLLPVDLQRMGKSVMLELGEQRADAVAGCGHAGGGRHRLAARCCANQGRGLGRSLLRALGHSPGLLTGWCSPLGRVVDWWRVGLGA